MIMSSVRARYQKYPQSRHAKALDPCEDTLRTRATQNGGACAHTKRKYEFATWPEGEGQRWRARECGSGNSSHLTRMPSFGSSSNRGV
jgi:hypothetical protein